MWENLLSQIHVISESGKAALSDPAAGSEHATSPRALNRLIRKRIVVLRDRFGRRE